jgi:predicted porin
VPFGNLDATGTFDTQRYVPWRSEMDETTWRLLARRSLSETVNGAIGFAHSKRDGSEFTRTNEAESDEINPIHIADRDRNKVTFMVDWTPTQPLTLTFNAAYAKDEYGHSDTRPYGLREGTATLFSIDAAYTLAEQWQLHAWYTRDHTKAEQHAQRAATGTAGAAEKEAELEDIGNSVGAGVRGVLMPRVRVGSDVLYSRNVNRYPETVTLTTAGTVYPAGITGPLPDIESTLVRIKLYAIYALEKNSDIRIDYIHERWKTDDWSYLFADGNTFIYGTTTDGTRVVQGPRQISNFIGLRYIYRFM